MRLSTLRRGLLNWHRNSPASLRRALQPLVDRFEHAYSRAAAAQGLRELGTYADHRLVAFDGVVCGIPATLPEMEVGPHLFRHSDVHVATTVELLCRKLDSLQARSGTGAQEPRPPLGFG
jgi:hypothetical protein